VDERSVVVAAMAALPLGTLQRNDGFAAVTQQWHCSVKQKWWSWLRDASGACFATLVKLAMQCWSGLLL